MIYSCLATKYSNRANLPDLKVQSDCINYPVKSSIASIGEHNFFTALCLSPLHGAPNVLWEFHKPLSTVACNR